MNEQHLPARRPTGPRFVEPGTVQPVRAYPVQVAEELEPLHLAHTGPAQAEVMLRTTYKDRSDGFVRAVAPLAAVAGGITLVAAVGLFSVPFLSFLSLLWFFSGFGLVWLVAYLAHLFVSPDGSTWLHTFMLWNVVQREQRFRHERFWTQYYDQRDKEQ